MLRILLFCGFLFLSVSASAQVLISFEFTSEDDNRLIRENDSFKCYVATGDSSHMACISEEGSLYRLFNKDHKLIAEGTFITEGDKYLQDGKWIARFENGKVKRTGYYKRNLPVGTWEEYYSTGKIKSIRNYAILEDGGELMSCLSGTYQEFYQNGNPKTNGFYVAVLTTVNDTITVNDPVTGQDINKLMPHKKLKANKLGNWETFTETGEPEKAEDN